MKTNYWLALGTMIAASAIAQNNTNSLPAIPAPVTSPAAEMAPAPAATETAAPAAAPVKQKKRAVTHVKAAALKEPTVALVAGPAEVTVSNLITRGQAGLKGEVIAHLFKGDTVTVLSQINLDKHAAGEPAQWAKIAYPTNAHVWVNAKYIDAANNVVSARKLNLRAGPGENYNVVGVLERGTPVSQVSTKDAWMKIEAPASAYAFVAAMYLKQEAPAPVVVVAPAPAETEPAPMPTPVPEAQPIVIEPTPAPAPTAALPAPEPTTVDTNVPPPPRVVSHEGVVRHVTSLITPTAYELYDPTTDKNVNFLHSTTTNLDLSRYVGMRIIVTGEEGLAARWADIPVLTIHRILVIDTNAVPKIIYRSPRATGQRR
jgi:uncharacterized protein YgiM (DUF1202 family)